MDNHTLEKLLRHEKVTDEECFDITLEISKGLTAKDLHIKAEARTLLVRVLDNWENIPKSYKTIFTDLISAAGFYPYLQKLDLFTEDLSEEIRMAYHKSDNLENRYFHAEQKYIDALIKNHVNVIVSAPTSFGKSMLIEEVVASKEYKNIVIIQPTLKVRI